MEPTYTGPSFWYEGTDLQVTRAIVTADRLAIDWVHGREVGGFVAHSSDRVVYNGTYGTPTLNPDCHVEFRLYRAANGEVMLFGEFWRADGADGGPWLLRLVPNS